MAQQDFYFIGTDKSDAMSRDSYWQDNVDGDYDKCFDEAYRLNREEVENFNVYVGWFFDGEVEEFFATGEFPAGFANRMRVEETGAYLRKEMADQVADQNASRYY